MHVIVIVINDSAPVITTTLICCAKSSPISKPGYSSKFHCTFYFLTDDDDLLDILEYVSSLKARYYKLGIALRLKSEQLLSIRSQFSNDLEQALIEVLTLWLKQKYNVTKFGPPTWRQLVKAVDNEGGGDNHALAKEIASKFPSGENF